MAKPCGLLADLSALVRPFIAPEARAQAAEKRAQEAEARAQAAEKRAQAATGEAHRAATLELAAEEARALAYWAHRRGTFQDVQGNSIAARIGNLLAEALEEAEGEEEEEEPPEEAWEAPDEDPPSDDEGADEWEEVFAAVHHRGGAKYQTGGGGPACGYLQDRRGVFAWSQDWGGPLELTFLPGRSLAHQFRGGVRFLKLTHATP